MKLPEININVELDSRAGLFFVLAMFCVVSGIAEVALSDIQSHLPDDISIEPWPRVAGAAFWIFFGLSALAGVAIFFEDR